MKSNKNIQKKDEGEPQIGLKLAPAHLKLFNDKQDLLANLAKSRPCSDLSGKKYLNATYKIIKKHTGISRSKYSYPLGKGSDKYFPAMCREKNGIKISVYDACALHGLTFGVMDADSLLPELAENLAKADYFRLSPEQTEISDSLHDAITALGYSKSAVQNDSENNVSVE